MSLRPSSYGPDRRKIERNRKIRGLAVNRLRDKSAFGRTLPHSNARDRQQQETTAFEHLAIVGGFLFVVIHGAGRLSLDNLLQ